MKVKNKSKNLNVLHKTRKQKRKEERQSKKLRKCEIFNRRKSLHLDEQVTNEKKQHENKKNTFQQCSTSSVSIVTARENDKVKIQKLEKEMFEKRRKKLLNDNKKEDKLINKLEKQLKINKTKKTSKSFILSGLDYVLELCDNEKLQDPTPVEPASDFEDDFSMITGRKSKTKIHSDSINKSTKSNEMQERMDFLDDDQLSSEIFENSDNDKAPSDENSDDDEALSDKNSDDDDEALSDKNSDDDEAVSDENSDNDSTISDINKNDGVNEGHLNYDDDDNDVNEKTFENSLTNVSQMDKPNTKDKKVEFKEDIYGRLRDKDGNLLDQSSSKKYIPSFLRPNCNLDSSKNQQLQLLKRQLKGLMNRLSENNMHHISNEVEKLYSSNSRNDMNNTLALLYKESLLSTSLTPSRLILNHAMLITILHANIGTEIGAYILQYFVKIYDALLKTDLQVEDKTIDNLILFMCYLYILKIFNSVLIFDIINQLSQSVNEKIVDLLVIIMQNIGFLLRKENPSGVKEVLTRIQKLSNEDKDLHKNERVKFMLNILLMIKTNNMLKLPQYDPTLSENSRKYIKTIIRKGNVINELNITLENLLNADEVGRWWIVGSAWNDFGSSEKKLLENVSNNCFEQKILDLAKAQRINTTNRKIIFCILMTAEDYMDAFEKLLRLGLKGQPEQDIIHVLIHCVLQEKNFNIYYTLIANELCNYKRRFKMMIQFASWDKFKELQNMKSFQITNLSKFLAHLFIGMSIPISILKVLQFSNIEKYSVRLLRQILLTILLHQDEQKCLNVFTNVVRASKLRMFCESLRLFMLHFILRNIKDDAEAVLLTERIKLVDKILSVTS